MKSILLIIFFLGCTPCQLDIKEKAEKHWAVLEQAVYEKWSQERVLKSLGEPKEKSLGKKNESWSYDTPNGYQEWSFSFDLKEKNVLHVGYSPTESMTGQFTLEKILARWKKLNCKKKKERIIKPHVIRDIEYYLCDGNKRINYNIYNEVSWIWIRVPK